MESFYRQVYVFGMARVDLYQMHPDSLKLVHLLPACFVLGVLFLLLSSLICPWALLPLGVYILALFLESLFVNKSLSIALLSIVTSFIQLGGYGMGLTSPDASDINPHAPFQKHTPVCRMISDSRGAYDIHRLPETALQ